MRPTKRPRPADAARRRALADAAAGVVGSLAAVLAFYPVDVWKTSLQAGAATARDGPDGDVDAAAADVGVDANGESAAAATEIRRDARQTKEGPSPDEQRLQQPTHSLRPSKLPSLYELFRGLPHKVAHTIVSSFAYFFVYSLVQSKYATYSYRRLLLLSSRDGSSGMSSAETSTETSAGTKLLLTAFAAVINTCVTLPLDTISSRKQAGTSGGATGGGARPTNYGAPSSMPSCEPLSGDLDGSCHASADDGDGDDDGFRSARGSFSEEFQSAHSEEDEGTTEGAHIIERDGGGSSAIQRTAKSTQATPSPRQRRRLYIKSPEKYKFSFSTDLAREAFATMPPPTAAAPAAANATTTLDGPDDDVPNERHRRLHSILSLWNGLVPATLLCTNPAIQYTMYDVLKGTLLRRRRTGGTRGSGGDDADDRSRSGKLSMGEAFAFGLASKFVATMATYPLIRCKVLLMVAPPNAFGEGEEDDGANRSRSEADGGGDRRKGCADGHGGRQQSRPSSETATPNQRRPPRTLLPLLLHIFRTGGLRGMYKGCSLQLLHTVLKSALLMMVREKITLGSRRFFRVEDGAA